VVKNTQIGNKFSDKYSGPHKIIKIHGPNATTVLLKNNIETKVNFDRLKPYYETDLVEVESDNQINN